MAFRVDSISVNDDLNVTDTITAGTIVKSGGTASQFLKANGSVDSTSYTPTNGSGASGTWGISITGNADTVDGMHATEFVPKTNSWTYGTHPYAWPNAEQWWKIAEVTLNGSCQSYNFWGVYRHTGSWENNHVFISMTARAECSFPSANEDHHVMVNMTGSGTNSSTYTNRLRVVLTQSSANLRVYELQFYNETWDPGNWEFQTNAGWTLYSSRQNPGTPLPNSRAFMYGELVSNGLQINGGSAFRGAISFDNAAYMVGSPSYGFRFNNSSDTLNNVIMHESGNVSIRGRLATGNVGVSSPDCMVVLQGNSGASGFSTLDQNNILHLTRNSHSYILFSSPDNYDNGIHFANTTDNGIVGRFAYFHRPGGDSMVWSVASDIRMNLTAGGTLTASGDVVAYGSPSDARLKTIKEKVPNALDKVLKLNGYRFDWNETNELTKIKEDVGVIAQEVAEVLPELARTNEDGFMSVRYQGLTAVLIEAIKEQQKQIEELKNLVNALAK
jgi:hypothetical protein